MTHPPILFRLMLCTLFMPIMIGICAAIVAMLMYEPPDNVIETIFSDPTTMLGVPVAWIMLPLLCVLPFVLYFWMFMTGNWRRPVLTATLIYGTVWCLGIFEFVTIYTPPEKRTIYLNGIKGADVYCNGVHLGQLPLEIRVDELIAKVPQWDTPPEQRWYDDNLESRLCTWVPWDNFLKERYEATQALSEIVRNQNVSSGNRNTSSVSKVVKAQQELFLKHDAGCRYWWSYRFGENQMAFQRGVHFSYVYSSFEKQSSYYDSLGANPYSPSVGFHVQLLADVLPELTPEQKADWDQHVLKNWSLIAERLKAVLNRAAAKHKREKNEPFVELYETALHSTARLKYGISDPPTEEECRRLLADWVKASIDHRAFRFYYGNGEPHLPDETNVLLPADINDTIHKPVMEQWRKNKFRSENGWAPVAYFSGQNKSPDYFADLARFSATSHKARSVLLENEAPGTTALFKTLLYRRSLIDSFKWQIFLYPKQINDYTGINNPLVETAFREYVMKALADPKHTANSRTEVEEAVSITIRNRMGRKDVDKDDLAAWVSTLPLPASSKNFALRLLRIRDDKNLTFADQLQKAAGNNVLIETELTLDEVFQWFDENPEGTLHKFLEAQEENISVTEMSDRRYDMAYSFSGSSPVRIEWLNQDITRRFYGEPWNGLTECFVQALVKSDTPEGDPRVRELIVRLWKSEFTKHSVEAAIGIQYGMPDFPQSPYGYDVYRDDFIFESGSTYLPEYILDLYLSYEQQYSNVDGKEVSTGFNPATSSSSVSMLTLCESPKAEEILAKWLGKDEWFREDDKESKKRLARCLEVWRIRSALRAKKMVFFQEIIAGRMVPDDLLIPQAPWVWKNGEYVQVE